jgi:hypothetical protein
MTVEMLAYAALSEQLGCSTGAARAVVKRPALERKLTQAEEQVALGYDRIAYQREIVLRTDDDGLDGAIALAILGQLEILQCGHIAERDHLLAESGYGNNPTSDGRSKAKPMGNRSRVP